MVPVVPLEMRTDDSCSGESRVHRAEAISTVVPARLSRLKKTKMEKARTCCPYSIDEALRGVETMSLPGREERNRSKPCDQKSRPIELKRNGVGSLSLSPVCLGECSGNLIQAKTTSAGVQAPI